MTTVTQDILHIFEQINSIPRCSKNEDRISEWLIHWAKEYAFDVKTDSVKNVLIKIPPTKGFEKSPILTLQGHMDMVCEKSPDSNHNFDRDAIEQVIDNGWLKANKTTLGADNGIALAIALKAAIDPEIEHPPLELLFTVDEETGLVGANNLEPGFVEGKILLNIDSEDEGIFTIGCAGGRDTHLHLPISFESCPENLKPYSLKVSGLFGGHSGVEIHLQRGNANQFLGRTLAKLSDYPFKIASLYGGSAHNALPRDAEALIYCTSDTALAIENILNEFETTIQKEFEGIERSIKLSLVESQTSVEKVFSDSSAQTGIQLLNAMPHGVAAMSREIDNLVETSNNFATIRMKDNELIIQSSQRSSSMSSLDALTLRIESVGKLAGALVKSGNGYPSWEPNMDSPLLKKCKKVYKDKFNKDAVIEIIHAGLECGIIGSKYSGMDMISFGPTIKNPHCPDEKLEISTLTLIWEFLTALFKSYK